MSTARKLEKLSYSADLETTIAGIPCQIKVTSYHPAERQTYWEPGADAEYEFKVYDRKGYYAEWLEKKMTDKDIDRIVNLLDEKRTDSYYDEP